MSIIRIMKYLENKKSKSILLAIVILGLLCVVFGVKYFVANNTYEKKSAVAEMRLQDISELTMLKYNFKNILTYKNSKQFIGFDLPLTEKSFIIVYSGYLTAGLDFSSINVEINDDTSVKVISDGAKITDNVINEESFEVYDEESSVFNELTIKDVAKLLVQEKSKVEKEALEDGFLDEANERAKVLLEKFFSSMEFTDIEVIIK
jgi:hypothetical protein